MSSTLQVKYIEKFLSDEQSLQLMNEVKTYNFQQYSLKVKGRTFTPSRKMCAFGNDSSLQYTFSDLTIPTQLWTPALLNIKNFVERECNTTFNYALLNYYSSGKDKIGMHKDNEFSMEPSSPIATISLGATRTLCFTRKKFNTENLPLQNGSLLIMHPSANKLWSHGIPAEPDVKDIRISITFRSLKSENKKLDEYPPPAKRIRMDSSHTPSSSKNSSSPLEELSTQCPDLEEDGFLDAFFQNLSPSLLEEKPLRECHNVETSSQNSETVFKKDIGGQVFLSCELFKGQLKIHIREYHTNSKGVLYPTKEGVAMDLETWYDFYLKILNFNFCYSTASFIANNSILVLNMKEYMQIKPLNNYSPFIQLNHFQKSALTQSVHEFNEYIINYLFSKRLPYFIQCERQLLAILSPEEEDNLMAKLTLCIEKDLCTVFQNIYECNGCIIDHGSQMQHTCITTSNLEKFISLGDKVLLLLNMQTVASDFVNSVDFISENFINHISVQLLKNVLFRSPH